MVTSYPTSILGELWQERKSVGNPSNGTCRDPNTFLFVPNEPTPDRSPFPEWWAHHFTCWAPTAHHFQNDDSIAVYVSHWGDSRTSCTLCNIQDKHIEDRIPTIRINYIDRRIYLRILGWTTIYAFSSTDENETSVLSRLILCESSKINNNNFKKLKNSLFNMW